MALTTDSQPSSVILFNKPFDVLCQFTPQHANQTISRVSSQSTRQVTGQITPPVSAQFNAQSPSKSATRPTTATLIDYIKQSSYYAAGRLDRDSEGLLVLTNDGKLQHRISHPRHKLEKTYVAQVEGEISSAALSQLQRGVMLKAVMTRPAEAKQINEPDWLWPRQPPIRERKYIPTSWICLALREGRNRQVRRMTAAVGYPTLRLIRTQVGQWSLDGLGLGEWKFA